MSISRAVTAVTMGTALAAVLFAGACSSPSDDDSSGATYNCEADTRDEQFLAGMQKEGPGGVQVTLAAAMPAPPGRDDNTWDVDLAMAGAPLTGAAVKVTPYMPDHRHGTSVQVVVTPDPDVPGRYELSPINLWMPGLWEITIDVTPAGGTRDSVVFRFCITG
ncbi:MAG TPA: FixH family protein [Kofleriaceae bacterium]|nr:FixH family protein [Kofleriaceae bacterium]